MSRTKITVLAICVVAAAAIAALLYSKRSTPSTALVKRGEIVEAVYGLGTVKTSKQYEVRLAIPSTTAQIFVKEGDEVKVGSPLIRFEQSLLFRTPIVGTVTLVDAHESELVVPQKTVLRVENLENRYIEVAMEQEGALRVQEGLKATVLFESLRSEKFEGKVSAIFSRNQEFLVHIQIDGLRKNILPGMTADVAIEVSRNPDALLVPLSALQAGKVITVSGRQKRKIPVKIGAVDSSWAEVLEGTLKAGDLVIAGKSDKKKE